VATIIAPTLTASDRLFQRRYRIVTTARCDTRAVDEDDLRRLKECGSELAFAAGKVLIDRGQPGTGLFVVVDGTLVVEAPEGTRELGPGSVFGERALLSADGLRTARVRALTDGVAVAVDRPEVDRLCAEDPVFAERLAELY
jgi:CRP-like cAMP-binding protein